METLITYCFHVPGTLVANLTPLFAVPFNCTLLHVSAVASNNSDATLKVGTPANPAAYLAEFPIGDSQTPAVKASFKDFVGGQYPRLNAGNSLLITLDYDGNNGTAAQNVSVALTLAKG
jgi:hypothetical protein